MIYFIIPVYNEEPNLPELLHSVQKWSAARGERCQVIAVDDGSRDKSARILREYTGVPVTLVRHEVNRGVDEVFRSGFAQWRELSLSPTDLVVTVEADNTSSLDILDKMIARARAGDDVVLASCYAPGGDVVGTTWLRWLLSGCANFILRVTPGMPQVHTFSSFYRVYRAPFLSYAMKAYQGRFIEEQGFVCVVEMLLKFGFLGAQISEVPLILDGQRRKGASKMKILRTIRGYLKLSMRAITRQIARPLPAEKLLLDKKASSGQ